MNFYKRYMGDYARDTAHLSLLEHGAYTLMLDAYYSTGKPLPLDRRLIHRMLRAIEPQEAAAANSILAQFWTETPEGWVNERADRERKKAEEYSSEQSRKAKLRIAGAKPGLSRGLAGDIAGAEPIHSHSHSQTPKPERKHPPTPLKGDSVFAEFWQAYPKKIGKGNALKRWKKIGNGKGPQIVEAIKTQVAAGGHWRGTDGKDYIPNPATWLNQGRWDDEIQQDKQPPDAPAKKEVGQKVPGGTS